MRKIKISINQKIERKSKKLKKKERIKQIRNLIFQIKIEKWFYSMNFN